MSSNSGGGPNKLEMWVSMVTIAFAFGAGVVLALSIAIWKLIEQARWGNEGAMMLLVFLGVITMLLLSFGLFSSVMWVNQKQDERAMAANMKMMQTNAIENLSLIEQTQKAMLLQSRTAGQNVSNDMKTLQLLTQMQQLQSGQQQPQERFWVSNDSAYSGLIEAEIADND